MFDRLTKSVSVDQAAIRHHCAGKLSGVKDPLYPFQMIIYYIKVPILKILTLTNAYN